jgi:uncharacterized protein (TIGR03435 family)
VKTNNRLVGIFLIAGLIGPSVLAQSFEVAVIKPARPGAQGSSFEIPPGGERFTATNTPLRPLIMMAYGVADWQVSGGPGWINSEDFDIEAKPEQPASREQIFQMLRSLLSDRFQLKSHKETREVSVYILTAAGKASGLHENPSGDSPRVERRENGQIAFHGFSMAQLAHYLSLRLRNEVTDKTMLTGNYDFELLFTPEIPSPNDITDAVQDQLGLRFQQQKASADALIIDSAVQPSGN